LVAQPEKQIIIIYIISVIGFFITYELINNIVNS